MFTSSDLTLLVYRTGRARWLKLLQEPKCGVAVVAALVDFEESWYLLQFVQDVGQR